MQKFLILKYWKTFRYPQQLSSNLLLQPTGDSPAPAKIKRGKKFQIFEKAKISIVLLVYVCSTETSSNVGLAEQKKNGQITKKREKLGPICAQKFLT